MGKTLADIAREIGVSTATISRVMNNDGGVTSETREKVLRELERLDYHPRARRRSVAMKNTDTVMIIAGQLNNPITLGYIDGIRAQLAAEGIRSVISLTDYDSCTERSFIEYAIANRYTGIFILNVVESEPLIRLLESSPIPVVLVNRYLRALDTDVVTVDNYRCGYMATQYLLGRGHRHIAHIAGPEGSITCRNRTLGYIDAMHAAGLEVDAKDIFYGDRKYSSGFEFGKMLSAAPADERATAVFATTALMAAGMVDALGEGGIRVPEDISVICNDDYSKDYMPYPMEITCFRQNPRLMGRTAADLLLERVRKPSIPPRRVVFPPELMEKGSIISYTTHH
ncbi:MAG: LacI family DNA-binding transcriptional regulator [Clostridia bacterium]|nr:LacI family DNA-binding transcriptional regulator [Clostridia bacterium]